MGTIAYSEGDDGGRAGLVDREHTREKLPKHNVGSIQGLKGAQEGLFGCATLPLGVTYLSPHPPISCTWGVFKVTLCTC